MAQNSEITGRSRFWITLIGIVILLIFLYFYKPFESYVSESIPLIRSDTIVFWFTSLVGVVGYAVSHWQSFRRYIFRGVNELDAESLVFDTLQTAILIAVIFCAGGTLQAIERLSVHLMSRGPIIDPAFGEKLLAIILLVILAVVFYLLHHVVRAFRVGWRTRRPPPRVTNSGGGS